MIHSPALGVILPIAQIVFTDLASLLERVRSAVLLVNVLRDGPLVVRADVMASDGEGELHVFEASPHLHDAVCAMIEQEAAAGRAEWRRLAVHVSADATIKAQAR
jgi:predicted cobalt transporter CbtA